MRLKPFARPAAVSALALALAAPAFAADSMVLPLTWRPTTQLQELEVPPVNLMQFQGVRIAVLPLADSRADKTLVGENREKDKVKPVTTKDDVPAFVTQHFKETLKSFGLPLAEKADDANVTVSGEILVYRVEETGVYTGEANLKVTVKAGGSVLWEGVLMGQNKRFGRSFKAENYQETLSDMLLDATARACKDPAFMKALSGKAPAR